MFLETLAADTLVKFALGLLEHAEQRQDLTDKVRLEMQVAADALARRAYEYKNLAPDDLERAAALRVRVGGRPIQLSGDDSHMGSGAAPDPR